MDFLESYAPVITWTTVRLVLLLSVLLNLHCRQVDFMQAFLKLISMSQFFFVCHPAGNTPTVKVIAITALTQKEPLWNKTSGMRLVHTPT